jgi:lysophospholipid acyltransferase (LPLAT)-like uncharacterized protein
MYRSLKLFLAKTPIAKLRVPVLAWGCDTGMDLLQLSWKMSSDFESGARELIDSKNPVIYAVYHGRMAGILSIPDREKTSILISNSTDGEMVARAMLGQGFLVSRGSPTHGARQAGKDMLKRLSAGCNVVVTVDGPRGPAMEMKPAVIRLAQTSGVKIIPMVMDAKHVKNLGSWDKFRFPHFFTSMKCFYGEPFVAPRDGNLEELIAQLDERMKTLDARAANWARTGDGAIPIESTSNTRELATSKKSR